MNAAQGLFTSPSDRLFIGFLLASILDARIQIRILPRTVSERYTLNADYDAVEFERSETNLPQLNQLRNPQDSVSGFRPGFAQTKQE